MAALEEVEATKLGGQSSVRGLVESLLPAFANSRLATLAPAGWNNERARELADRKLLRVLRVWLEGKNLDIAWMIDVALFTLAIQHHRPSSPFGWRTPPVVVEGEELPQRFTFSAAGWRADFESRGEATQRLRNEFQNALRLYADSVASDRVAPGWHGFKQKDAEKKGLQWVAVHHVYGWSTSKIAREWRIGKSSRAGGTGRAHVSRTLKYWRQILVLPDQ